MLSINTSEPAGEVPALQSLAMAIGMPCARNASIGGKRDSRSV